MDVKKKKSWLNLDSILVFIIRINIWFDFTDHFTLISPNLFDFLWSNYCCSLHIYIPYL
jgi:hypothetical protein